jgi:glycosyltransferase involved in cell wall biosynthesis
MESVPKISIIIPVYNGETYIGRCVDSVLNQTFRDVEILLLNDGSADNSLTLLHAYEQQHPHIIRVISHENMGVAKTRNKGVRLARAKYIMFLDQDDYIERDYCETFFEAIEQRGCDVVMGGYRRPNAAGKTVKKLVPTDTPYYRFMIMAAWAKIHRTEFLIGNDIAFFDNAIGEDIVFTLKEIRCGATIEVIPYSGYNWFFNEQSVSNTGQQGLAENIGPLFALLEEITRIEKAEAHMHADSKSPEELSRIEDADARAEARMHAD